MTRMSWGDRAPAAPDSLLSAGRPRRRRHARRQPHTAQRRRGVELDLSARHVGQRRQPREQQRRRRAADRFEADVGLHCRGRHRPSSARSSTSLHDPNPTDGRGADPGRCDSAAGVMASRAEFAAAPARRSKRRPMHAASLSAGGSRDGRRCCDSSICRERRPARRRYSGNYVDPQPANDSAEACSERHTPLTRGQSELSETKAAERKAAAERSH